MSLDKVLLTVVTAYLIGSFPTAYLIGRLHGVNIFEVGSGNMGTANVTRILGLKWGLFVWGIDICKGIVAVLLARGILLPHLGWANTLGALFAVVGHNWSLFATLLTGRVRGGKGAATWWGTFMMLVPAPFIAVIALVFAGVVALTRYISLAVLSGVLLGAVSVIMLIIARNGLATAPGESTDIYLLYALAALVMVFYRHRDNIQRLLAGTERRLGEGA